MKIGIISINTHTKALNFACPLHTYAFQQFLSDHGIESTVIDYMPIYNNKEYDPVYPLHFYLQHGYNKALTEIMPEGLTKDEQKVWTHKHNLKILTINKFAKLYTIWPKRYQKFENFINAHYIRTKETYHHDDLDDQKLDFDCYICATDVIWQYNPDKGFDRGFFLAAEPMKNAPKIGYAVSRGVFNGWTKEQEKEFIEYTTPFEAIAARESSFAEHIHELTGKDVPVVLDPVFLKDKKFWHDIAIPPRNQERKYVLLYAVMERAIDSIQKALAFAKEKGLELIILSSYESNVHLPKEGDYKVIYNVGPDEWLGYIEQAEYIFTNSFHACAFSILFEKQFYVGARHGDKVDTILKTFDLEDRRFTKTYDSTKSAKPIDYSKVGLLLEEKRKASGDFILNAIHSVEKKYNLADTHFKKEPFNLIYASSAKNKNLVCRLFTFGLNKSIREKSIEFRPNEKYDGNAVVKLAKNPFRYKGFTFLGWYCRTTFHGIYKWYCTDGQFHTAAEILYHDDIELCRFQDQEQTDAFTRNRFLTGNSFFLQAVWQNNENGHIIPNIERSLRASFKEYMVQARKK